MNKQDLISFIKLFNKKPGEYSIEDAVTIGVQMRKLPRRERDWNWLINSLGLQGFSCNALQKRVERRIKKLGSPQSENDIIGTDVEKDEALRYREEYSSSYKEREWVNAYRRMIREDVRIDNLKEEIKLAVNKLNALTPITSRPLTFDPNEFKTEAVLLFSDLHIGVDCDNYYNKYNLEVAQERVSKLLTEVTNYCYMHRVRRLNVLNLGDLINGCIHVSSRIEQEMDVVEQVMYAAEILSQFLNELTKLGIEIVYRSVSDNHSRVIADKNQHIEKEQFSKLIDWYIAERLKDTSIGMPESGVDFSVGKFKVFNKTIMFAHGHQGNKNSSAQEFIGLTREWVDYICLGHYHSPAIKDYQGCKIIINGSIVGTEQYAFSRHLFTKPSQKLLIFQENSNSMVDIDIAL